MQISALVFLRQYNKSNVQNHRYAYKYIDRDDKYVYVFMYNKPYEILVLFIMSQFW